MSDLAIIYYTANLIHEEFAAACRKQLLEAAGKTPIIAVSHQPIDFGRLNILVTDAECSSYQVYLNILIGAETARELGYTYVACAEDDTLYPPEHFEFRPPADKLAYDMNRWSITKNPPNPIFFWRDRVVMGQCIAPTELLIAVLRARYDKYPTYNPKLEPYWGEPGRGRVESALKLPPVEKIIFHGQVPTVAFKHRKSLGGVRNRREADVIVDSLPPWGSAKELWKRVHG